MTVKLNEMLFDWNEKEIKRYEKLIQCTNKTVLKNKHIKKYLKHVEARNNKVALAELYSMGTHLDFLRSLKRCGLIKRLR